MVTGIYTNWRRKANLEKILMEVKRQSYPIDLWVVDNASGTKYGLRGDDYLLLKHGNELKCWQRWVYAMESETKYTYVMDDDLIFGHSDIIKNAVEYMEDNADIDCIGHTGVIYDRAKGYFGSRHVTGVDEDVDIVKGRFMFFRTSSLEGIDTKPDLTCDDIKISGHFKKKRILSILADFDYLKEGKEALFKQSGQKVKREKSANKYINL